MFVLFVKYLDEISEKFPKVTTDGAPALLVCAAVLAASEAIVNAIDALQIPPEGATLDPNARRGSDDE